MRTYALENRGRAPLYEYLYRCIRGDILDGTLTAGERLPSKRALAEHLHISVMTVEGAYQQLEAEGYVSSVPGKGSFAAPHSQVDSARRDGLLRTFDETATELFFLGLSADALSQRLSKLDGGVRQ